MQAARERLFAQVEPAIALLTRVMQDETEPTRLRMGAANSILDRVGISREHTLHVEHTADDSNRWAPYLTDEQLAQIATWIREARERGTVGASSPVPLLTDSAGYLPRAADHATVDADVVIDTDGTAILPVDGQ